MRPERGDVARLWDMADAPRRILDSVRDVAFEDWLEDGNLRDADVLRLALIGEAANHVSMGMQSKYPEFAWRQWVNQRNALIHRYVEIDYDSVWETVQQDLPELVEQIEKIVALESGTNPIA